MRVTIEGGQSPQPGLARRLFQELCGFVDLRGQRINRGGNLPDALFRFIRPILFQAFADLRHRLDAVTGVEAGRVDLMLEPVAPRQPAIVTELAL